MNQCTQVYHISSFVVTQFSSSTAGIDYTRCLFKYAMQLHAILRKSLFTQSPFWIFYRIRAMADNCRPFATLSVGNVFVTFVKTSFVYKVAEDLVKRRNSVVKHNFVNRCLRSSNVCA